MTGGLLTTLLSMWHRRWFTLTAVKIDPSGKYYAGTMIGCVFEFSTYTVDLTDLVTLHTIFRYLDVLVTYVRKVSILKGPASSQSLLESV